MHGPLGGRYDLLELLHADFLAALALVDLFDDIPQYLDLLLLSFQHLIHFARLPLVVRVISPRVEVSTSLVVINAPTAVHTHPVR